MIIEWLVQGLLTNIIWLIIVYLFKTENKISNNCKKIDEIKTYFYTRLVVICLSMLMMPISIINIYNGYYLSPILLFVTFIIVSIQFTKKLNNVIEDAYFKKNKFNKKQNSSKNNSK